LVYCVADYVISGPMSAEGCGLIPLTKIWVYPHIRAREPRTACAEAMSLCRLEPQRPEAIPGQSAEPNGLCPEPGSGWRRAFCRESADRAVYTVRFAGMVYVLHAFQKKAKKGIATPQQDIELIKSRLRDAELHYRTLTEKGDGKP
jgi:hypothetical protein